MLVRTGQISLSFVFLDTRRRPVATIHPVVDDPELPFREAMQDPIHRASGHDQTVMDARSADRGSWCGISSGMLLSQPDR
jgi:hypothetical protein